MKPSSVLERIHDLHAHAVEIPDVSGDDHQIMNQRRRSYQAVGGRECRGGVQLTPLESHLERYGQDAAFELLAQPVQPSLQGCGFGLVLEPSKFDTIAQLTQREDAQILPLARMSQSPLPHLWITAVFAADLRNDIGIEQPARHR